MFWDLQEQLILGKDDAIAWRDGKHVLMTMKAIKQCISRHAKENAKRQFTCI